MNRRFHQSGQGSVEFLLAAPVVLLLGLGSIEGIHWYFARQAASHALLQAGRAAITRHADPAVLDAAFSRALLRWFVAPSAAQSRTRLERAIARREQATGLPAWQIRVLSPSASSFEDFSTRHPDLPNTGHPVIDNDYLSLQHQAYLDQGWPEGRGPVSRQTILEANTLVLELTWLHEPLLPGVRQLLKQVAPADTRYGSLAMARAGFLPLRRQISLLMQSHPVAWALPAHGRVARQGVAEPATGQGGGQASGVQVRPSAHCQGLWCLRTYDAGQPAANGTGSAGSSSPGKPGDTGSGGGGSGVGGWNPGQNGAGAGWPHAGVPGAFEGENGAEPVHPGSDAGPGLLDPLDACPGCCDPG